VSNYDIRQFSRDLGLRGTAATPVPFPLPLAEAREPLTQDTALPALETAIPAQQAGAPAFTGQEPGHITILGPRGSGKTTYLGALTTALQLSEWSVYGEDGRWKISREVTESTGIFRRRQRTRQVAVGLNVYSGEVFPIVDQAGPIDSLVGSAGFIY